MGNRVVTVNIEDKDLTESSKSKATKVKQTKSESEVEKYGIVEINNSQARSKLKNKADAGYEKHAGEKCKKSVKQQLSDVDYFDFELKPAVSASKNSVKENESAKSADSKNSEKISSVEVIKEKSGSSVSKNADDKSKINLFAEVADRVSFDDEAEKIVRVARIGALFDCEKVMIN